MTKKEIIDTLKVAVYSKYSSDGTTLNYGQIHRDCGMNITQVKALFENAKNPGLNSILALGECVGVKINVAYF